MLCLTCKNLSFQIICKDCQANLLIPSFHKREIEDGFFNYSFYSLSELEDLISSKYYFHGDRVFNILAKLSFAKFAQNFSFTNEVYAIPIDDHTSPNPFKDEIPTQNDNQSFNNFITTIQKKEDNHDKTETK